MTELSETSGSSSGKDRGIPKPTGPREKASLQSGTALDHERVLKARDGDALAFDQLVEKYKTRIYGVIYNILGNHEDAADLSQEAFVRAFRSIGGFRRESNFYTWLYRIAVNTTLNFLRSNRENRENTLSLNQISSEAEKEPIYEELTSTESVHRNLHREELQEILNKALQKLSEQHRVVVVLHDIEGLRHQEIARILRCTEATARSRLFYAHQELQSLLAKYL